MSFVVTTGLSEIYDILTHLTFLYIEAKHIYRKTRDEAGAPIREWRQFEEDLRREPELSDARPGKGYLEPEHHSGENLS